MDGTRMSAPLALVLTAPGTNRDRDVADALELASARAERVPLHLLRQAKDRLREAQLIVLAGGFSHGDALGSGAVWANDVRAHLADELRSFVADGKAVLGICNGFQALVRTGLLPGSLDHNQQGSFVCEWITMEPTTINCVWTDGLVEPIECPIAHGEGRYIADANTIAAHGALRYIGGSNPNGSMGDTAGVTDSTGRILGLMPHPENHIRASQHPRSHRRGAPTTSATTTGGTTTTVDQMKTSGLALFAAGVRHARRV